MTRLAKIWLLYRKLLRLPLVEWRITLKLTGKSSEYAGECLITGGSCCQMHEKDQEESAQQTGQESEG